MLGVGFNAADSRLYYSIWANDLHNTGIKDDPGYATTTLSNTVRSVQIAPDGSFVPGTDLLEVTLPKMGVGFSMPVSDITFNAAGTRMLLAELESASNDDTGKVALLSVEPDHVKHRVKVTAEARTLELAIAYVERLQKTAVLRFPMLDSHELKTDDKDHPVRFQVSAEWSDAS